MVILNPPQVDNFTGLQESKAFILTLQTPKKAEEASWCGLLPHQHSWGGHGSGTKYLHSISTYVYL